MTTKMLSLRDGKFEVEVYEQGSGSPLLFLHGIMGPTPGPFLDALAQRHRVIMPAHPGFGETTGDEQIVEFFDIVYYYLDLLDALDLHGLPVIGHSLGGMFAAELAAVQPERFTKLALLAPIGLWNEAHPVLDYFVMAPGDVAAALYHDLASPAAQAMAATPHDEESRVNMALARVKAQRVAARYMWPIPNRGLAKRIHRIKAPVLLAWGESDGLCPPAYAEDWKKAIPGASVEIIPNAGHMLQEEQPEKLAEIVGRFIGG
jgi:pimeloyl-ACP methyl ester carboxylesterase